MTGKSFIDNVMQDTDRFDNLTTDTTYRALCLDWLNRVLKNISGMQDDFHWRFLEKTSTFPTVATQLSYDLPANLDGYKIFDVRQTTTDLKLTYISQEKFDELYPNPTSIGGNPNKYTLWASSIRLLPTPSAIITMTIRYIKTITLLTDAAVSGDTPVKWDDVILQGVLAKAYKFDKRLQDSIDAHNQFLTGMQLMKSDNEMIIDYINVADSHRGHGEYFRTKRPAGI